MRRVLLSAPLFLGACAAQGEPVTIHQVPPGSKCIQSSVLASYVGEPATAQLSARLMAASQARTVRWVPHGTMVTMDHRDDRLTVWLGPDNRVQRANCG